MKLTAEIIRAQKLAHKAHIAFGGRVDKWGYLVSKCIPCKAEYITRDFCDNCADYVQVTAPNQTHCPSCNTVKA